MIWRQQRPRAIAAAERATIVVDSVTKRYGRAAALHEVTFEVAPGESVALWGPNGAGKTTLLRCLLGLARYSGEIRVEGHDPRHDGPRVREAIGYVPQELPIVPMTVRELVEFVAALRQQPADAALARLEQFGIGEALDKRVAELSGGMRQRLSLALALIGSPRLLLLDEPTANLDATGRARTLDRLRGLKRDGHTLVFSSHRAEDVLALADRILLINQGVLERDLTLAAFHAELGAASRLVLTLQNGQLREALTSLRDLGYDAAGTGRVITVPIATWDKARVLASLTRDGIEIADFDLEHQP